MSEGRAPLREVAALFSRLGLSGFGGPLAHFALMEAEVVERRRWLSKERFLEGLAFCQLLPGPASTQLGIYIGYALGGFRGACLTGLAFILPGFVIILTLTWLYSTIGATPHARSVFLAMNPAIIAVVISSCVRLGRSCVTSWTLGVVGALGFVLTLLRTDVVVTLLLAGGLWLAWQRISVRFAGAPAVLLLTPPVLAAGSPSTFASLAWLFFKAGALVYGGGYVIIPLVQREAVERHGWMSARTFLDGMALAQLTPGPIVNISAFVGYQVAGLLGAGVGAFSVFFPAFLVILAAVPLMDRFRSSPQVRTFLQGINAAVVGAILGAMVPLSRAALGSPSALGFALLTFLVLWRTKISPAWLILTAGALGLLLSAVP